MSTTDVDLPDIWIKGLDREAVEALSEIVQVCRNSRQEGQGFRQEFGILGPSGRADSVQGPRRDRLLGPAEGGSCCQGPAYQATHYLQRARPVRPPAWGHIVPTQLRDQRCAEIRAQGFRTSPDSGGRRLHDQRMDCPELRELRHTAGRGLALHGSSTRPLLWHRLSCASTASTALPAPRTCVAAQTATYATQSFQ